MASIHSRVVILGTGGTIAGTAASPQDHHGYRAAQLSVAELVAAVPSLAGRDLQVEQVAQLDSKDMDVATWQRLAQRTAHHLSRDAVAGIVITHGTDTLEETAYFLQRVLAPHKPVVLTAAMRPATSSEADGPQNLADAVQLASLQGAHGVLAVMAGAIHAAADVRKRYSDRIDAFDSGAAGPLGRVESGQVRLLRPWPVGDAIGIAALGAPVAAWPRVELLISHAGADGRLVEALCAQGIAGLVVAGTGNGTLHERLEAALRAAQQAGVAILRTSRCADGVVLGQREGALPSAGGLPPVKARIELMLELLRQASIGPASA